MSPTVACLLAAAALLSVAHALPVTGDKLTWRSLPKEQKTLYTFEHFTAEFEREYMTDEVEMRRTTFEAKLTAVHEHNAGVSTWVEGVNQLTDRTDDEVAMMKGKMFGGLKVTTGTAMASDKPLPKEVDWRTKNVVTPTKNQGGCGSCWAFSATETVESAIAMNTGKLLELAPQEFVDCVPNPDQCGGSGGCAGSTEEYGFAYAMLYGMASEDTYAYTARTGTKCLLGTDGPNGTIASVGGITNFVKLPANDQSSLMAAISTVGPVAISVDASWGGYESGVYQGCNKTNLVIDHAVQLVGYGTEKGTDYFLVRNSWGAGWGQDGYIKLLRSATPTCADDSQPGNGNGCKKGTPDDQSVCGECGMLSDSSYALGGYVA